MNKDNGKEYYIRLALPQDAIALTALSKKTFFDTFASQNDPVNMEMYSQQTFHPEIQLQEILDPSRRIFLAWQKNELIGLAHLLQGPAEPAIKGPRPIELFRLYVDVPWHGKGVAHALMQKCLETGRELQCQTLWLGVWEKNWRAQQFYNKWELREVGQHVFWLGKDPQRDILLERPL